tara:strand:- start:651 stop:971 length:321 start_codon:yes stop_codon:yes gene_type:complete
MASKNLKTIHLKQLGFIQNFIEDVYGETGEEVVELYYKEIDKEDTDYHRFGFRKGHLEFTPFSSMVYAYKTRRIADLEGEEVEVKKTYSKREEKFVVTSKLIKPMY